MYSKPHSAHLASMKDALLLDNAGRITFYETILNILTETLLRFPMTEIIL